MQSLLSITPGTDSPHNFFLFKENPVSIKAPGEKIKILMVDDDRKDIQLFQDLLAGESRFLFSLQAFTNPTEALYYLEKMAKPEDFPDVMITDLVMPETNGKMLLRYLKTAHQTEHLPIIVHSSMNNHSNITYIREFQACAFFEKPLNAEAFVNYLTS